MSDTVKEQGEEPVGLNQPHERIAEWSLVLSFRSAIDLFFLSSTFFFFSCCIESLAGHLL